MVAIAIFGLVPAIAAGPAAAPVPTPSPSLSPAPQVKHVIVKTASDSPDERAVAETVRRMIDALELEAMERIIGRAAAEKMLLARPYYRWIYKAVVEDRDALRELLRRHGLVLP
jgi:hypothetical protein